MIGHRAVSNVKERHTTKVTNMSGASQCSAVHNHVNGDHMVQPSEDNQEPGGSQRQTNQAGRPCVPKPDPGVRQDQPAGVLHAPGDLAVPIPESVPGAAHRAP